MTRLFRANRHFAWALALTAILAVGCGESASHERDAGQQSGDSSVGEGDGSTDQPDASLNPFRDGGTLSCPAGMGDCDKDGDNGCEADLSELANCGTCGNACEAGSNANVACNNSQCVLTSCKSGFADCDTMDDNGCETDLNGTGNCGSCGNDCGLGDCMSGSCTVPGCDTANTLKNDCDGDPTNGCETDVNTLDDCGNCNIPCDLANGTETCTTGVCEVDTCDNAFDDCNHLPGDGCEQALNTNAHCGVCDTLCAFDNAAADCSSGSCEPGLCAPDFKDCNLDIQDDPNDGCERLLTTLSDCGDCNVACNMPNATESCSTGTCTFSACESGWVDVNADSANAAGDGCECQDVNDHGACSMAKNLGNLPFSLTPVTSADKIAVQGGEDWYTFTLASSARAGHSLEISITNDVGGLYKFDLVNGCVAGVSAPYTCKTENSTSVGMVQYQFGDACSGGAGGCFAMNNPKGQFDDLAPTVFLVRVYRPTGPALTCAGYTLNVLRK